MRRSNIIVLAFIILVSFCLAVTAVLKVREIERRARCRSNLGQLSIALMSYYESYDSFPSGTIHNSALPPDKRLSWLVDIMPYEEGKTPFWQIDKTKAWDSSENEQLIRGPYTPFVCPSNPQAADTRGPGQTSYIGIGGICSNAPLLSPEDRRVGVFAYDRRTTRNDIKDGASNTIMVAETAWENGPWAAGGPATVRGLEAASRPYLGKNCQFGGLHPKAACTLFADGSVRCIKESIDALVFEGLCTIAGGEDLGDIGEAY